MAKDNFPDSIAKLAAIVGGAWLAAEIIKAFAKKETVYSCPVCNEDITYGENPCHNCHSHLRWPNQQTTADATTIN
jgi:hypothetical protein